jgi:hypothetical protein
MGAETMVRVPSLLLFVLLSNAPFFSANAQIEGLTWEDPEVVDLGVSGISSNSGPAAVYTPDYSPWSDLEEWHVVYEKDGDIYHRVRITDVWIEFLLDA